MLPETQVHKELQCCSSTICIGATRRSIWCFCFRGICNNRSNTFDVFKSITRKWPTFARISRKANGPRNENILDENGVVQGINTKGEVCIRGPNVTKGYKNNPEANKSAFQTGWFHTGDVGYLDSDRYLYLVGRIKELINRGGMLISTTL